MMNSNAENKIVIFTLNEIMRKSAVKVVESMGLSIEVVTVTLDNYIDKAEHYKLMNKEIIIARGLVADKIRANVDIHVITIEMQFEDILERLCKPSNSKKKIAIGIADEKLTNLILTIGKLLGFDLYDYSITKVLGINYKDLSVEEQFNEFIKKLKTDEIEVLIALSYGSRDKIITETLGIDFKPLDSDREAIIVAVKKAVDIYEITMKERTEKERFKTVIDHSTEGILAIDQNGVITIFNNICEKYLSINASEVLGKNIDEIFPEFNMLEAVQPKSVINKIVSLNNVQLICDYIPIKVESLTYGVVANLRKINEVRKAENEIRMYSAERRFSAKNSFDNLIGKSKAMKEIISLGREYSEVSSTVLIIGESGTGKEVLAQAIHNNSPRKNYPFVPINCAALPPHLLESELFGYAEGAFTGSRKGGKQGLFELAHNGTIFLDEIGDMDLSLQVKLLRVIQERQILRVGDNKMIPINVRIISATNKNLYEEVKKNNFRLDLYFRLDVLEIKICPLKDRKEDLADIVSEILSQLNSELNFQVTGIDSETFNTFLNYSWPGNIRELRNILERLVVRTKKGIVKFENVKNVLTNFELEKDEDYNESDYTDLEDAEKSLILKTYEKEGFHKQRTAEKLGISRHTLRRKLEKYNIE